ncbi:Iron-sulfur clusters incorporation protein [Bonamia ostreae]|uniref:Iron-sulfur clusters incorporation protein n=1 Tax=Bonamia ostreae TaxID=126728 RepID=A0ABV2AH57_9EUKA
MWNKFQTLHFKRFSKTALPLFGPILHKSILSKNSEKMLCKLKNRVIIKVIGKEANNFVQNLVTANIIKLENGKLLFGLFLNRKSEILADCFFFGQDNDVLIDCAKEKSTFLLDHLSKYNLRKKVDIKLEEPPSIYVYSGKKLRMRKNVYDDPRAALLGKRIYDYNNDFLKEKIEETTNENFYSAHLATNGIQNTITSEMKDCNPFSLNYDLLNAIDFKKGCYLGQELVSQIHSTGSVRKRLLPALIIKVLLEYVEFKNRRDENGRYFGKN